MAAQIENRQQISLEDDNKETNSAKRMKKEPGAVTGKSVVVLRHTDVTRNETFVFMPNTIEMAQIKKHDKGQFKTNVQISSMMTEKDIEKILVETFPILRHQRFWCAAAVENRTRLDFHGEPRIWDGQSIKRKIKGNSALYILITDELQQHHGDRDPSASEQITLKRSHDQIITNEQSKQSKSDVVPEKMQASLSVHHAAYPGLEKQAEFFAAHGNPLKHVTSYPVVVSGPMPTAVGTNDNFTPTEKQSIRQEGLDKFPASQGFFLVTSQHLSTPVCGPSIHSIPNARDVVTMATPSLPPSFPMGAFMVPAGGIVVASSGGLIGGKALSTTPDHQSLGKTVFHVPKGQDVLQTGLPMAPQAMVTSTLTPEMNRLNISNATSQQSQKPVMAEKSIATKNQNIQTEQQDPPMTTLAQSSRSLPVEYSTANKTTSPQEDLRFKSPYQSESMNSSQMIEKGASANTAITASRAAAAADRHQHRPALSSDYESMSSDQTDSGIETTDNTREVIAQPSESYLVDITKRTQIHKQNVGKMNEAEWPRTDITGGDGLSLLTAAVEIREQKPIVQEICPKRDSVRGGNQFILILNEHLPADFEVGYACFGESARVGLKKVNEINLTGIVPASQTPGRVPVKVMSLTGSCLGETSFEYIDEVEKVLRQLVHNKDLQRRFFFFWAQGLGNETSDSETRHLSQPPSDFNTLTNERPNVTEISNQLFSTWDQGIGSDNIQPAESFTLKTSGSKVKESDYDADDEDSSDSSEDGSESCGKGAGYFPNPKMLSNDDGVEQTKDRENEESFCEPLPTCMLDIFRQIGEGTQANLYILYQFYGEDLGNVPSYTLHGSERGASIVELEPSASSPLKCDEEGATGGLCDDFASAQNMNDAPGRSNNTENMDIDRDELNSADFDHNSAADKTKRAEERSDGEAGDCTPDSL